MKPVFKHDCEHCEYVGSWITPAEDKYGSKDFYYCKHDDNNSLVIRFSDDEHDTASMHFHRLLKVKASFSVYDIGLQAIEQAALCGWVEIKPE